MMTTLTDHAPFEVIDWPPETGLSPAPRAGRVWRSPKPERPVEVEPSPRRSRAGYVAGIVTAAVIVAGVFTTARLDDGPAAVAVHDVEPGSMYAVVDQIGARSLWEQGYTGAGVNVAVIDTGIAPVGALMAPGKVQAAIDFSAEQHDPTTATFDNFGHGTHLAGIIAGHQQGADPALSRAHPEHFLGVAPDAGIVSVKVAGRDGSVDPQDMLAAIDWVVAHADQLDIGVLTLAYDNGFTGSSESDPLAQALERAWQAGIVVVTAAGNDGADAGRLSSPANDPTVIAVGGVEATESGYSVPDWASSGDGVRNPDLAAPGAHIRSLRAPGSTADVDHPEGFVDRTLFLGSGSSQSAAVVSGAAALLLSARPDLTPDAVKQLLADTADPIGASETIVGAGVIDVAAAVSAAPSVDSMPSPATGAPATQDNPSGSWNGSSWTGSSWMGSSWMGSSWMGSSWMGSSWMGSSWMGSSWMGSSWMGSSWMGSSWMGSSWMGSSWMGSSWMGSSWMGSSWM